MPEALVFNFRSLFYEKDGVIMHYLPLKTTTRKRHLIRRLVFSSEAVPKVTRVWRGSKGPRELCWCLLGQLHSIWKHSRRVSMLSVSSKSCCLFISFQKISRAAKTGVWLSQSILLTLLFKLMHIGTHSEMSEDLCAWKNKTTVWVKMGPPPAMRLC